MVNRIDGKLFEHERNEIKNIILSNSSFFTKYKEIEYTRILNDHSFYDPFQRNIIIEAYLKFKAKSDLNDDIENDDYSNSFIINITDVDDLFGQRFYELERKLFKQRNPLIIKNNGLHNIKKKLEIPQCLIGMVRKRSQVFERNCYTQIQRKTYFKKKKVHINPKRKGIYNQIWVD